MINIFKKKRHGTRERHTYMKNFWYPRLRCFNTFVFACSTGVIGNFFFYAQRRHQVDGPSSLNPKNSQSKYLRSFKNK